MPRRGKTERECEFHCLNAEGKSSLDQETTSDADRLFELDENLFQIARLLIMLYRNIDFSFFRSCRGDIPSSGFCNFLKR